MRLFPSILALGFLWRLYISWRTPIPSEDGVNYLWMAERFAEGEFALGLSDVFQPLLSLLTALPIAAGLDPFWSAQLVLCIGGTLAILPLARATEILVPGGGPCAGCLLAFAPLPTRFCGEVYTEPLFLLFGGMAVWLGLSRRWWHLGLWSGLAFWVRPEALILPIAFALVERAAWKAILPCAALVIALAVWRGALGHGFEPVAKFDLILERSVVGDQVSAMSPMPFLQHLLQIPWLCVEAFGPVALLAVWGLRRRLQGALPLYWAFGLAVIVICAFLPRRRFLVNWLVVVTPIAVSGYHLLPRASRAPLLWAIVVFGLVLSLRTTDPDRIGERRVGEHLASILQPGEEVTGDMTRVIYYAGQRPLVPRRFSVEEVAASALGTTIRYVVLGERRDTTTRVVEQLAADFELMDLPVEIAASAGDRGILVLRRK